VLESSKEDRVLSAKTTRQKRAKKTEKEGEVFVLAMRCWLKLFLQGTGVSSVSLVIAVSVVSVVCQLCESELLCREQQRETRKR